MPAKASGLGALNVVDEFDGGFGWISHPDETMERTSHALAGDDGVWAVDPVDAEGIDARFEEWGGLDGVVVLYNYHRRDAAAIAARHDVSVYLPEGMSALSTDDFAAPVERFEGRLPGTEYHLRTVTNRGVWQEWALCDGETLVVAESVGTADYFTAPGERLGVSLVRRPFPPAALDGIGPERVLCGHGEGISADAAGELERAISEARRTAPRMYLRHGPTLVRTLAAATL
ncbi:hypothetical protein [Natronomonas amylolytica]|uniref:hypothetical protein n=1 Tax=Natronomonas amylolytica TaxID=3108498 RepID=UPI00300AC063